MMKSKNILIIVLCILVLVIFGLGLFYAHTRNEIQIVKNGFTFRYPKTLKLQEVPSTEGNYANYQISIADAQKAKSTIMISIPLKNTSIAFTLADAIKPFGYPTEIKDSILDEHKGKSVTYRQDSNTPGDIPVHGTITYEQFDSRYTTSPLMIRYFKDDQDTTLETAWTSIRKSLSY